MIQFDFSPANTTRIQKAYRDARKTLTQAEANVENIDRLRRLGYRNMDALEAEMCLERSRAQRVFDAIKAEREAYRARGFCR